MEKFCNNDIYWVDLYDIFIKEPIVIKGAVNFSLKNIARAMFNHSMINTIWTSDIINGFGAMMEAINYYKNNDVDIINNIIKYNEVDCKVMWEIVKYLRENNF
jgi:predicted RecB family nuclease